MRKAYRAALWLTFLVMQAAAGASQTQAPPPAKSPAEALAATAAAVVILPSRIIGGQPATLAVLDENGRLVPGARVEFDNGSSVTTDEGGRALFTVPAEARVILASLPGRGISAASGVESPDKNPPGTIQITQIPKVVSGQDHFSIQGTGFSGDASKVRVFLGSHAVVPLATSPLAMVLLPGRGTPPGPAELRIEAEGRAAPPLQISVVRLELVSEKRQFPAGEKGTLLIRAIGTDQRLVVEARNLAPEVLALPRGQVQRVATRGGADNVAVLELIGLHEGDFSVSVRLIPGAAGLPDVETARLYLLAGLSVSPEPWTDKVDRLIRRLERDPDRPGWVRNELEKLLAADTVTGEFRKRLEAAQRILNQ